MAPRRGSCFLTYTIKRLAWSGLAAVGAFALTLSAECPGVSAEQAKAGTLPPGVASCNFNALANDQTREGLNIRAEPRADSAILGRLKVIENANQENIAADVHVIGVKNGWFLIEGAAYGDYDLPKKLPPVYGGRGWVSGKLLTTGLRTSTLKATPDENAAVVVELHSDENADSAFGASEVSVTAILDCKGEWFRVEAPVSTKNYGLKPKLPSDGPKDVVRGWTRGSCTNQRTTCV
jgi:hypothetical protein